MHRPDSKIADLLPRIVERAARRSDQQDEEPWVKPSAAASSSGASNPASRLPAGASFVLLVFAAFPSLLAFLVTGLTGSVDYSPAGGTGVQLMTCIGAPLVHTTRFSRFAMQQQLFSGALVVDGLMWLAITFGVWWSLHAVTKAMRNYWEGGERRFTIGQLLAISIGIAMTFSAWRWDLAAGRPWESTVAAVEKAYEQGEPAGPSFQPLYRFSFPAAVYAYLGVGCTGMCLINGGLWVIRQFLPRRPGEDKSLLQQIF